MSLRVISFFAIGGGRLLNWLLLFDNYFPVLDFPGNLFPLYLVGFGG